MKKFNEKQIAVTYRNIKDFDGNYNLKDVFTISLYSPLLGVIVDWTCDEHEDNLFNVGVYKIVFIFTCNMYIVNEIILYFQLNLKKKIVI